MKLRDIVLGGAVMVGLVGCASREYTLGPNCDEFHKELKKYMIPNEMDSDILSEPDKYKRAEKLRNSIIFSK